MQQHILGAIEVSGKTIAVLGCGPDVIYPEENVEIYKKILETGGAIVSEYPSGTTTASERFRQRNRIVSALSLGVLIVEAKEKSGTGITANFAREHGKTIFCIPSSINNRNGVGTNNQIRKGAKLVLSPNDILEEFGKHEVEQITIEDLEKQNKITTYRLNEIKEDYREIYKVLSEPLSINEISDKTGISITEVYSKLFMMELEGLVEQKQSKYVIV